MIGWILRVVIAFAVLTLIYFAFLFLSSFYARQKFAREYADEVAEGSVDLRAQASFVDQRMEKFRRNTRWRLGLTIYGIPVLAFGVLIWLAQFS